MITSVIEMLELLNFDHITICTIMKHQSRLKVLQKLYIINYIIKTLLIIYNFCSTFSRL